MISYSATFQMWPITESWHHHDHWLASCDHRVIIMMIMASSESRCGQWSSYSSRIKFKLQVPIMMPVGTSDSGKPQFLLFLFSSLAFLLNCIIFDCRISPLFLSRIIIINTARLASCTSSTPSQTVTGGWPRLLCRGLSQPGHNTSRVISKMLHNEF